MWTLHTDSGNSVYGGQTAKNICLGDTRIVTKLNSGDEPTYNEEYYKQYYYHSDHLGSATLISDYKGDEYQRIEYTPYGETWVEKTGNTGLEYLPYKFTGKEIDEETGLYYYGARYLDPRYSRWISTDPALGEYIPGDGKATASEAGSLPGMGGIFNTVNLQLYHYAGNNPVKYTDPDGRIILGINEKYNMSAYPLGNTKLGNSTTTTFKEAGCYVTTFANIFSSSEYYGLPLAKSNDYNTPEKINNNKSLFAGNSSCLKGRTEAMNALFGEGKWDYWTKDKQGIDGLVAKINDYAKSENAYMIVGIFDLSTDNACADNHMVGLSEGPDSNGVFHNMTATSNGDQNRGINIRDDNAYNINNLKEIRVIFLEE